MKNLIRTVALILVITGVNAQTSNKTWNIYKNATHEEIISNIDFQKYVREVDVKLAQYNSNISDLKVSLMCEQNKASKKLKRKVASIENENKELTKDLNDFINYGIGNWKLFRLEFNMDLALVSQDLNELGVPFSSEDFFAFDLKK